MHHDSNDVASPSTSFETPMPLHVGLEIPPDSQAGPRQTTEHIIQPHHTQATARREHCIIQFSKEDMEGKMAKYKLASGHPGRPYKCGVYLKGASQCYKAFATEIQINEHIRGHLKNVKYLCLWYGIYLI
jgi:hypothetical protein